MKPHAARPCRTVTQYSSSGQKEPWSDPNFPLSWRTQFSMTDASKISLSKVDCFIGASLVKAAWRVGCISRPVCSTLVTGLGIPLSTGLYSRPTTYLLVFSHSIIPVGIPFSEQQKSVYYRCLSIIHIAGASSKRFDACFYFKVITQTLFDSPSDAAHIRNWHIFYYWWKRSIDLDWKLIRLGQFPLGLSNAISCALQLIQSDQWSSWCLFCLRPVLRRFGLDELLGRHVIASQITQS